MLKCFSTRAGKGTLPLTPLRSVDLPSWLKGRDKKTRAWVQQLNFTGKPGSVCPIPGNDGPTGYLLGLGEGGLWAWAAGPKALPPGRYRIAEPIEQQHDAVLGWALGSYRFTRYRASPDKVRLLTLNKEQDYQEAIRLAEAQYLVRDLVNTPASDMGPAELAAEAKKIAKKYNARVSVTVGKQLLDKNYPTIHAVGRASVREPRLIDIRWGQKQHPKVTLVGKGVCFDSGGLDLKPADGMLLMKKDMGGAAHVLGLGAALMDTQLPVRLRILIPAVENSVDGNAFRPLDVLTTRSGLTVEVGNTDAEGRLILCDALTEAIREKPELVIDFATLTGAARVALGTEIPALFSNDDAAALSIIEACGPEADPVWRMPLFAGYRRLLDSRVADINNISRGRFGGAITAALFLKEFVGDCPWVHFDVMAWNVDQQAGRPIGGEAMGLRATYRALVQRYAPKKRKQRRQTKR